jgi:hypothetical protein
MIIDKEFVAKAVLRIDELQNDMINKSNSIPGIKSYIKKEMSCFLKSTGKIDQRLKDNKSIQDNTKSVKTSSKKE